MKKLKFILAFAMLFGCVATIGAVTTSNEVTRVEAAEEKTYEYTFASGAVKADGNATLGNLTWTFANATVYQGMDSNGRGFQFGTGKKPSTGLSFETTTSIANVTKIEINTCGASSISASFSVTVGGTQIGKSYALKTTATDHTLTSAGALTGAVKVQYTSANKAVYVKSIAIYTDSDAATETGVTVNFDANGGTFADTSKWTEKKTDGDSISGTLPTAEDLSATPYKYTKLVGWSDVSKTYAPGESYTVSKNTIFTAVYEAPELITIAQALEICALTGTNNTTYAFTVQGVVSELDASGVSQFGNFTCTLTDDTGSILAFRVKCDKTGLDLLDGDVIKVTGILINYNGSTPEFTSGASYEFVSRPVVEPTLEEKLAEFTTNASVGFSYTKSGEDYTFSNVRLSFRGTISAELYDEVVAAGVTAAGIECSIEGEEPYTIDCSANIGTDAEGNKYVFGSLLVPEGKENIVVTGKAFVTVDGARLYLASTAHSLVSAVSAYLGDNAPALTAEQLEAVTALAASLGIDA